MKTIKSDLSGHDLEIRPVPGNDSEHPAPADQYKGRYRILNAGTEHLFFYVANGYWEAPREVHVWYPNGQMWSSFDRTIKRAIEGAQRDGWKYATNG